MEPSYPPTTNLKTRSAAKPATDQPVDEAVERANQALKGTYLTSTMKNGSRWHALGIGAVKGRRPEERTHHQLRA